jgi:poly(3-hydroxyalkanoate) synthetase
MQIAEEITNLKETIKEAQELLAYYQQELVKDPSDFAQQLRFNSFKGHVAVLENQLAKYETQTEIKENINYEILSKRFRLINELDFYANIGVERIEKLFDAAKVASAELGSLTLTV